MKPCMITNAYSPTAICSGLSVEIADCGNLTLASSRLNRSQSAVSVQVRKLETELKTTLFVREGKGCRFQRAAENCCPPRGVS